MVREDGKVFTRGGFNGQANVKTLATNVINNQIKR